MYSLSNFGIQRDTPSSCTYILSLILEKEANFFIATLSSQQSFVARGLQRVSRLTVERLKEGKRRIKSKTVKKMNYVSIMKEEVWWPKCSQASLEAVITMLYPLPAGQRACGCLLIMLCSDSFWELLKTPLYEIRILYPGGGDLKLMLSLKNNDVSSNTVTHLPRVTWL